MVADENNIVTKFVEKPKDEQGQINGGFFVMKPRIFDFISGDDSILEKDPLEEICGEGRLCSVFSQWFLASNGHTKRQTQPRGFMG